MSPLFAVTTSGTLRVATPARPLEPGDGDTVIWLTNARDA
jgi:hypothetical protein